MNDIRQHCLELALELHRGQNSNAEAVLATAKAFEVYILGKEEEKVST